MGYESAFGEGKILEGKHLKEATDRVAPNHHLTRETRELLQNHGDYVTLPDHLMRTYQPSERDLTLSVTEPYTGVKYTSTLLSSGETIALKAELEGWTQFFLSEWTLIEFENRGLSIIRFYGPVDDPAYLRVEHDTRTPKQRLKPTVDPRPPPYTLHHDYRINAGIDDAPRLVETDIVTKLEGLAGRDWRGYYWTAKGLTVEWEPLGDYIQRNYSKGAAPYGLESVRDCYHDGVDIMAGARTHKERGEELHLTKEAYTRLAERGLCILRGRREEGMSGWEELRIMYPPVVGA